MSDDWQPSWRGDPAERYDVDIDDVRAALLIERPSWHLRASCRGMGTARWYTGQGQDNTEGRAICASCAVLVECRDAGADELHGMWGATTASQRVRLRSQRPAAA